MCEPQRAPQPMKITSPIWPEDDYELAEKIVNAVHQFFHLQQSWLEKEG